MASKLINFRVDPKKENELFEFFAQHGPKPGIKKLYDFYKNYNNVESIIKATITSALGNIKIQASATTTQQPEQEGKQVSKAGMALFGSISAK